MTLREYFIKLRELLLTLDDRSLGVYVVQFMGEFSPRARYLWEPVEISWRELHTLLQPPPGREDKNAPGAPKLEQIHRLLAAVPTTFSRTRDKENYESHVLAVGQRVRDLINGDPTALWNLNVERVRSLERTAERVEGIAREAELRARYARESANEVQKELAENRAELARLEALRSTV
jgi:hypothetical protein